MSKSTQRKSSSSSAAPQAPREPARTDGDSSNKNVSVNKNALYAIESKLAGVAKILMCMRDSVIYADAAQSEDNMDLAFELLGEIVQRAADDLGASHDQVALAKGGASV